MDQPYDQKAIGPVLARLRQARGYSQMRLAQLLCLASGHPTITRHEVSRWEREERIPSEFWLQPLSEVLDIPIEALREAVATTRSTRRTDYPDQSDVVASWLTLHHGPHELMIALGGAEVDQLRTVLAPVRPPQPADPPTSMEARE